MHLSLNAIDRQYNISCCDVGISLIFGFSGLPYSIRHWELSNKCEADSLGHRAIAILEAIPILGGLAALAERIVVYIYHKFFTSNNNFPNHLAESNTVIRARSESTEPDDTDDSEFEQPPTQRHIKPILPSEHPKIFDNQPSQVLAKSELEAAQKLHSQNTAVIQIQKAYRGYLSRKNTQLLLEKRKLEKAGALGSTAILSFDNQPSQVLAKSELEAAQKLHLQNTAVIQIQKACRGYLSRKAESLKSTAVREKITLLQQITKWLRIEENQKQLQGQLEINPMNSAISDANGYLQSSLKQLYNGINCPLPLYYHATSSANCGAIIKSKQILVTKAACGTAAWISTNDEWEQFGRCTLALDDMFVKTMPASYFPKKGYGAIVHPSLWVGVKKPILINKQNLAAIVVRDKQDVVKISNLIKNTEFSKCAVLLGRAGDVIHYALDRVLQTRKCPSAWKPAIVSKDHYCYPFPAMPLNATEWAWNFSQK